MAFIKSWTEGVALAAAAGSIAVLLSPGGRAGKGVKTAVSLFIIIMFVSPFFKGDIRPGDIDFSAEQSAQSVQYSFAESTKARLEKSLRERIRQILEKNGIMYEDIIINIEANENENTIDVKNITVITNHNDTRTVKNLIESETGVPAVIKAEE